MEASLMLASVLLAFYFGRLTQRLDAKIEGLCFDRWHKVCEKEELEEFKKSLE